MIVGFLVFLPFTVGFFFTNFDSVYFRFDLTLFTFRLLNFVIDIPSYYDARFSKSEPDQNAIRYTHFWTWSRSLTSMTGVTNAMYMLT